MCCSRAPCPGRRRGRGESDQRDPPRRRHPVELRRLAARHRRQCGGAAHHAAAFGGATLADRFAKLGIEDELFRIGARPGNAVLIGPEDNGVVFDWEPTMVGGAELLGGPRGSDLRLEDTSRPTRREKREQFYDRMDAKAEARAELGRVAQKLGLIIVRDCTPEIICRTASRQVVGQVPARGFEGVNCVLSRPKIHAATSSASRRRVSRPS